jgi:hypothetical protein
VEIDFIQVIENTIFLQKSAEFRQPSINGSFAPIVIHFIQTGPSTVDSLVMDDEIISNSTGELWNGFLMFFQGNSSASFNPQMTSASGGGGPIGFSIDPFTNATFIDTNRRLVISGGTVEDDDVWWPGGGLNDGQLWINVQSGAQGSFSSFDLNEQPMGAPAGPVCNQVLPPAGGSPVCGSSGNALAASVINATSSTSYAWQVVNGPCVIQSGNGTASITYSVSDTCPIQSCCLFRLTVDDLQDTQPPSICERQVCCECSAAGTEGRTPGFWKQPHHFGHWPSPYCPSTGCGCDSPTQFCEVFDCAQGCSAAQSAYAGKTLLEVLRQGGGKFKALGRHAVAALLNSAMDDDVLDYEFTTTQVIDMVNHAMATCKSQPAHGALGDANEGGGGSLGGQSHCTDLDLDGLVDSEDLAVLLSNWGRAGAGDIDNDGIVGVRDLNYLLAHWGTY